jgi:hypothetical protein
MTTDTGAQWRHLAISIPPDSRPSLSQSVGGDFFSLS